MIGQKDTLTGGKAPNRRKALRSAFTVLVLSTTVWASTPATPAHAWATSADILALKLAQVKAVADQTTKYLNGILSQTNSMIASLLSFSTQNSANNANAMKLATNIADVQDARAVQLKVEQARYDAQKSATSGASLCNVITGAAATQNLERMVNIWRTGGTQTILAYANGHITNKRGAISATTQADIYETGHCANSATDADYQRGRCGKKPGDKPTQEATAASSGSDNFVGVADDQNAGLIINGTDFTPKEQEAMSRFLILFSPPDVGQSMASSSEDTPERRMLNRKLDALAAKRSVVVATATHLVGDNIIVKGTGSDTSQEKASEWAEATASKVAGYVKKCVDNTCKYFPNGVSVNDIMELESRYWFYNLVFGIFASAEGQAPSQKDLNAMQAFQIVMDYRRYRVEREMDMNLAGILSIMTEERQEKLNSEIGTH